MKACLPPENVHDLPYGKTSVKGADMNQDGQQQEKGADDEREEGFFDQSLPFSERPHVSLQGKGSWVKLLIDRKSVV